MCEFLGRYWIVCRLKSYHLPQTTFLIIIRYFRGKVKHEKTKTVIH